MTLSMMDIAGENDDVSLHSDSSHIAIPIGHDSERTTTTTTTISWDMQETNHTFVTMEPTAWHRLVISSLRRLAGRVFKLHTDHHRKENQRWYVISNKVGDPICIPFESPCRIHSTKDRSTIVYYSIQDNPSSHSSSKDVKREITIHQSKKISLHYIQRSLSTLEELSLTGRSLNKRFRRALGSSKTMTKLILNNNKNSNHHHHQQQQQHSDRDWKLPDAFPPNLQELSFSWNGIGPNGALSLTRCLEPLFHGSHLLQSIKLCGNPIGRDGNVEGIQELVDAGLLNIPYVNLWDCQLGDDGAVVLGKTLMQNALCRRRNRRGSNIGIRTLILDKNGIGDRGARALASGLFFNYTTLETLHLYCNEIGDDGMDHFSQALTQNKSLKELSLCANRVGSLGAQHLASTIHQSGLQRLYLSDNNIGDCGAQALAIALEDDQCPLQELVLSSNDLGNVSVTAMAEALIDNERLHVLAMDGNPRLNRRGASSFLQCLRHNKYILELRMLDNTHENHLLHEKLDFYLGMNRLGRRHVGNLNIPDAAWSKILASLKGRPDYIFAFLQARPDLVRSQPGRTE